MQGLTLLQPGPLDEEHLRLRDVPVPSPGPDELLLRVSACAVCRTDLQICQGDVPAHRLPLIPGHQAVGRVVSSGLNALRRLAAGQVLGAAVLLPGGEAGTV